MENEYGRKILAVQANGGSVSVEKMVEGVWVVVEIFARDGAWPLELGNSATRFTPVGGALYEVGK